MAGVTCCTHAAVLQPPWIGNEERFQDKERGRRHFAALAAAFVCSAPQVHDGDSLRCVGERIRIANNYAPEMPYSPKCTDPRLRGWCDPVLAVKSRDTLRAFLVRGLVTIRRTGIDRYGRTFAQVTVNGTVVGRYLVGLGLARRWR